jgi:predicted nuclease with TOPRIM domain
MKQERQIFESKLREADERVAAWEVENAELVQKCELLRTEKLKVERRMDLMSEDLEVMSYQRDQEGMQMEKMLDEKLATIEILKA